MDAAAFAAMQRRAPSSSTPRAASWSTTPRCSPRSTAATSPAARSTSAARPTRCRRRAGAPSARDRRAAHRRPDARRRSSTRRSRQSHQLGASCCRARCRVGAVNAGARRALAALARRWHRRQEPHDDSSSPWPGACDCHMHVYEDALSARADARPFKPPHAPAVGLPRGAARARPGPRRRRQPTGYGFDNRCTLAALAALGARRARIVVVAAGRRDRRARATARRRRPRRPLHDACPAACCRGRALEPHGGARSRRSAGTSTCSSTAASCRCTKRCSGACRAAWSSTTSADSSARSTPDSEPVRSLLQRCSTPAPAGSRSRRHTRARAASPPGYDDIAWIARLRRRPLSRAVPVGEQLAASEPEPGARRTRRCSTGRSSCTADAARRGIGYGQPGRALRFRA